MNLGRQVIAALLSNKRSALELVAMAMRATL
jgi:hypothetical protein